MTYPTRKEEEDADKEFIRGPSDMWKEKEAAVLASRG